MKQYAVMRIEKIKSKNEMKAKEAHNLRAHNIKNVNKEKSHLNINFKKNSDFCEILDKKLSGIKIRKNAILAYEIVLTASHDFFDSNEKINLFNKKSGEWIKEEFGEKNIISAVLHLDELTPHLHIIVTPIDERGKLCGAKWTDGPAKMHALQNRFFAKVESLGLSRGEVGSKAKHEDIKSFGAKVIQYAELEAERIKIKKEKETLEEKIKKMEAELDIERKKHR